MIGGIFFFLPSHEALLMIAGISAVVATVLVGQTPRPKAFIRQNRRLVAVVGWTTAALGLLLSMVMGWKADQQEARMAPGLLLSVVGLSFASLAQSLKTSEALAQIAPSQAERSGVREGLDALASPFRDLRASAVVLGPWFVLFVAAPLVGFAPLLILDKATIKAFGPGGAFAVLGLVLAAIGVMYGALMAAAIQWARFISSGKPPPLAVPWRALWSFTWRWFVFGGVSRLSTQFGSWLKTHYPALPDWASVSLTSIVGFAILILFSQWGLVLPAIALGARNTSITGALRGLRRFGGRFYLGALVVLAPVALLGWLSDLAPAHHPDTPLVNGALIGLWAAWVLSFFVTVPAAMTYLTRVYLLGETKPTTEGVA
jgi:hypothetical protein